MKKRLLAALAALSEVGNELERLEKANRKLQGDNRALNRDSELLDYFADCRAGLTIQVMVGESLRGSLHRLRKEGG